MRRSAQQSAAGVRRFSTGLRWAGGGGAARARAPAASALQDECSAGGAARCEGDPTPPAAVRQGGLLAAGAWRAESRGEATCSVQSARSMWSVKCLPNGSDESSGGTSAAPSAPGVRPGWAAQAGGGAGARSGISACRLDPPPPGRLARQLQCKAIGVDRLKRVLHVLQRHRNHSGSFLRFINSRIDAANVTHYQKQYFEVYVTD